MKIRGSLLFLSQPPNDDPGLLSRPKQKLSDYEIEAANPPPRKKQKLNEIEKVILLQN